MSKKTTTGQFSTSQDAIRKYMGEHLQYQGPHEANVTVIMGNKVVFEERLQYVSALIETNKSYVTITWPKVYESIYYMEYSNIFQIFSYDEISNVLTIECQDRHGNDIIITLAH